MRLRGAQVRVSRGPPRARIGPPIRCEPLTAGGGPPTRVRGRVTGARDPPGGGGCGRGPRSAPSSLRPQFQATPATPRPGRPQPTAAEGFHSAASWQVLRDYSYLRLFLLTGEAAGARLCPLGAAGARVGPASWPGGEPPGGAEHRLAAGATGSAGGYGPPGSGFGPRAAIQYNALEGGPVAGRPGIRQRWPARPTSGATPGTGDRSDGHAISSQGGPGPLPAGGGGGLKTPRPAGWPPRMLDWVGRRVRLRCELRNGYVVIPEGAVAVISGARSGVSLTGPACTGCGLRPVISGVDPHDLDLLPPEYAA